MHTPTCDVIILSPDGGFDKGPALWHVSMHALRSTLLAHTDCIKMSMLSSKVLYADSLRKTLHNIKAQQQLVQGPGCSAASGRAWLSALGQPEACK